MSYYSRRNKGKLLVGSGDSECIKTIHNLMVTDMFLARTHQEEDHMNAHEDHCLDNDDPHINWVICEIDPDPWHYSNHIELVKQTIL